VKYLIDTHVLLWAAFQTDLLSDLCRRAIGSPDNEILVSAATAWEIATKFRLGKLPFAQALTDDFIPKVTEAGYLLLPISVEHALRAGRMAG
jgi:PIN domain nuclease of toxin-antitoxin system